MNGVALSLVKIIIANVNKTAVCTRIEHVVVFSVLSTSKLFQ